MHLLPAQWTRTAPGKGPAYLRFLERLKGKRRRKALELLPGLHQEAFSCINCRQCANCCKTISPRFKTPDIKRIARNLGIRESELIQRYLKLDEEGDYVVQSTPCPFLGEDLSCTIYEARPGDCRNYPYTDRDVFLDRPQVTRQNAVVCPAVFYVLEKLMEIPELGS
ncbi:MAG TPA: YkgJ family cysteine cluster protein [Chitinophagaceae bacterium]|nr:YkgJ family cysteine cluster protein [Chitinophagaceae bacterium]